MHARNLFRLGLLILSAVALLSGCTTLSSYHFDLPGWERRGRSQGENTFKVAIQNLSERRLTEASIKARAAEQQGYRAAEETAYDLLFATTAAAVLATFRNDRTRRKLRRSRRS